MSAPAIIASPAPVPPDIGTANNRSNRVVPKPQVVIQNAALEPYTFVLRTGETQTHAISGNRFFVVTATGPVNIRPAGQVFNQYVPGQSFRAKSGSFTQLNVKNPSTTAQLTVTIIVGFDDFESFVAPLQPGVITEWLVTIAQTNTVQALATMDVWFTQMFLYGYSALAVATAVNNGANVYIGKSTTYLPDVITPGEPDWPLTAPAGKMLNAANLYILGQQGDGLFVSAIL